MFVECVFRCPARVPPPRPAPRCQVPAQRRGASSGEEDQRCHSAAEGPVGGGFRDAGAKGCLTGATKGLQRIQRISGTCAGQGASDAAVAAPPPPSVFCVLRNCLHVVRAVAVWAQEEGLQTGAGQASVLEAAASHLRRLRADGGSGGPASGSEALVDSETHQGAFAVDGAAAASARDVPVVSAEEASMLLSAIANAQDLDVESQGACACAVSLSGALSTMHVWRMMCELCVVGVPFLDSVRPQTVSRIASPPTCPSPSTRAY